MLQKEKGFIKNMNLTDKNMYIFRKSAQKVKKTHNNLTFHDSLEQFHSCNRNWLRATRVFKAIMNTRNVSDKC